MRIGVVLTVIIVCFIASWSWAAAQPGELAEQLLAKGQVEAALAQTEKDILTKPRDVGSFERSLRVRVRALLAANRPQEALQCAKSLFNVIGMGGTADAVALIYQCLGAAYPNDLDIRERFRAEQQAGAVVPAQWSGLGQRSVVMDSIHIDAQKYEQAMAGYKDDLDGAHCKGNLLLMADRAKEARPLFEKVYETAPDDRLYGPTENLARCMKAEDGTIGRANAFVLSLRPKREPAGKAPGK